MDAKTRRRAARNNGPVLSEDLIARDFVDQHENMIRYDAEAPGWYVWDNTIWRPDKTAIAFEWTRHLIRGKLQNEEIGDRRRMGSLRFARGVEGFAKTDQRIVVTRNRWDQDVDLIGTPTGIVDLRTGDIFEPEPDYYITRAVAVDPENVTLCPRWFAFLNQVTNKDAALKDFLKQWCGYSLTGEIREQKLCFIHGPSGTGKTTFKNILRRIAHDYAVNAAMETFSDSKFDQHPEQLARLDGPRVVIASETEAGHKWRENRIKLMTGGDEMTAHFMRQNSFDFLPRFKLTFVGNFAPAITHLDSAIRRRFIVVPFLNLPAEIDDALEEALMAEAPGILRWMIQGAQDWYNKGLVLPKAVTEATTQYFDDQDMFAQWLEECCDVDPGNQTLLEKTAELYASWSAWIGQRGEVSGTQTTFNQTLRNRGFEGKQIKALGTKGCYGIRLKLTQTGKDKAAGEF
jgi:putative DNA primase/helicase